MKPDNNFIYQIIGLLLILSSIILYFNRVIPEIFIAAIITLGITLLIEHRLWDKLLEHVTDQTSRNVQKQLASTFTILENSEDIGLVSILSPIRSDKTENKNSKNSESDGEVRVEYSDKTIEIISRSLQVSEGEILIMGISLYDFLNIGGKFYEIFLDVIKKNKRKNHIKILILNPETSVTRFKALLENGPKEGKVDQRYIGIKEQYKKFLKQIDFLNKEYYDEIARIEGNYLRKNGAEETEDLCEKCNKIKFKLPGKDGIITCALRCNTRDAIEPLIEYKTFEFFPPSKVIITENDLFIQEYNMAPRFEINVEGCITRGVPLFQYKKGSSVYKIMKSEFEFLWKCEQPITIEKLIDHYEKKKQNHLLSERMPRND